MKNILLVSVVILALFSCKKKEEAQATQQPAPTTPNIESPILGNWSLIKAQGFFPTQYYSVGDVQWNFSSAAVLSVDISDELEASSNYPLFMSGDYSYSLISSDTLLISDFFHYRFQIQNDSLLLSVGQIAADGKVYTFKSYE